MDSGDLKRFYASTGYLSAKGAADLFFWLPIILFLLILPSLLVDWFCNKMGIKRKPKPKPEKVEIDFDKMHEETRAERIRAETRKRRQEQAKQKRKLNNSRKTAKKETNKVI